jgi:hypothetical protein
MDMTTPRNWPIDLSAQRTQLDTVPGVVILPSRLGRRSVEHLDENDTLELRCDKTLTHRTVAQVVRVPLEKAAEYLSDHYVVVVDSLKHSHQFGINQFYKLLSRLDYQPEVTIATLAPTNSYK